MKENKVVVCLSGGLDSATLLGYLFATHAPEDVVIVTFLYSSKHSKYEVEMAARLSNHYQVESEIIDVTDVFGAFQSALLDGGGDIPEGHYTDESMKSTVVPGRNMIFASILAGYAQSIGGDAVALGIHSGDHAIYPDCRPAFLACMRAAISAATENAIDLKAPFINKSKAEIVALGIHHKVPYHLTRTCYKDQPIACGKCGSCVERLEAFQKNGLTDPLSYEKG